MNQQGTVGLLSENLAVCSVLEAVISLNGHHIYDQGRGNEVRDCIRGDATVALAMIASIMGDPSELFSSSTGHWQWHPQLCRVFFPGNPIWQPVLWSYLTTPHS